MDLSAFKDDARHFGVSRAVLRAAYYRARAVSGLRLFRMCALEPHDVNPELLTRRVPFECRMLAPEEIPDALHTAVDPEAGSTPDPGDLCFAILEGTTVASAGWYASRPSTVQGLLTVSFAPEYLYRYAGYTQPRYRGLNLHGIGLARATMLLHTRGYAGLVSLVEIANFASIISISRTGFQDIGRAMALPMGGRIVVRQTRAPTRYALRLSPLVATAPPR